MKALHKYGSNMRESAVSDGGTGPHETRSQEQMCCFLILFVFIWWADIDYEAVSHTTQID